MTDPERPPAGPAALPFRARPAAATDEQPTAAVLPVRAPADELRLVVVQDGRVRRGGEVSLSALDPGLLAGVGVFETMRVRRGRVVALDQHLARLADGARALGLRRLPHEQQLLVEISLAQTTLGEDEAVIRVSLTAAGALWVRATPAPPPRAAVAAVSAPALCLSLAGIKHMSRAVGHAALAAARAGSPRPVDELIWREPGGGLLEGTWSNVLAVINGEIWTAPTDGRILPGVTRARALAAAATLGLPVCEAPPPADGLDELWCMSAVQGLVPVVVLDERPAPGAGPIGRALAAALDPADVDPLAR
jgi:branched-subunit amino acid aminotransferase/4-amino-4-deoxychorismate lyase